MNSLSVRLIVRGLQSSSDIKSEWVKLAPRFVFIPLLRTTMKKITSFLISGFVVCATFVSQASATPASEKTFVDGYKKAFEAKDAATLETYLYTKGADPMALKFYRMMMTAEMGSKITKIELRSLTPEEATKASETMPGPDGQLAKLPVTPTKKLVYTVDASTGNGSSTSSNESYVAEVNGKFVIPVPASVK